MKKLVAILLVLILAMSFAACGDGGGSKEPPLTQLEYYSVALPDGWYFDNRSTRTDYDFKNVEIGTRPRARVGVNAVRDPDAILPDLENQFEGNTRVDDVTIGGIVFYMVVNEERNTIDLLESTKAADAIAVFRIRLDDMSLEDAIPLLETLKMNDEMLDLDEDEMEEMVEESKAEALQ